MRGLIVGLVGVVLISGTTWQGSAFGISLDSVEILPQPPTSSDALSIVARGVRGNTAQLLFSTDYWRNGTEQGLDLHFYQYGNGLEVITPWSHSEPIGFLPANSYDLTVHTYFGVDPVPCDTYSLTYTVLPEPATDGDLNGDGFVGGADLDIVRAYWGRDVEVGNWLQGDPSGDGCASGADLDIVRSNWGAGVLPAPGVVPEPSAIALLVAGALGLLAFARQRR